MKKCPQCGREYDLTMSFCLDDGSELLYGPATVETASSTGYSDGEAQTAIVSSSSALMDNRLSSAEASAATDPTAVFESGISRAAEPRYFDRRLLLAPIVLVFIVLGSLFAYRYIIQPKQIGSIAVMPFVNESGNPEVEYLSDGMTETLINSLSKLPNLSVKARSSVFHYKGKETKPQTLGRELSVQAILNGRVLQRGEQLSLGLELIDAETENVIWSESYVRRQTDLISLQGEIARDVSSKLKSKLSGEERARVSMAYTENPEAYQLYLKGNFYSLQYTKEGLSKGMDYYRQAIALDPDFALAHNGIAHYYIIANDFYLSPSDSMPRARAAAQRALAIDDSLADGHASMAVVLHWYDWDWAAAEKEFQRAIELDSNNPRSRLSYAFFLSEMGRFDEAVVQAKEARSIDPLSPVAGIYLGKVLLFARRNAEAIEELQKTVELNPNFWVARAELGEAYEQKGDLDGALKEYLQARDLEVNVPLVRALVGRAYALLGRKADAQKVIDELTELSERSYVPQYNFAIIYAGLGNKDEAFSYLNRACDDRSYYMPWLKVDPQLDSLRDDPRFGDLLKRVGLSE